MFFYKLKESENLITVHLRKSIVNDDTINKKNKIMELKKLVNILKKENKEFHTKTAELKFNIIESKSIMTEKELLNLKLEIKDNLEKQKQLDMKLFTLYHSNENYNNLFNQIYQNYPFLNVNGSNLDFKLLNKNLVSDINLKKIN